MPRLGAHMSVAGGLPRAVERAVVHRCDALQIFAKNANQWRGRDAAARGDPRVSREGEGGRHRAGRLARQLPDQPGDDATRRCAGSRSRRWATRSIAPRRSACSASCCIPAAYTVGQRSGRARRSSPTALLELLRARRRGKTMVLLEHTAGQGTSLGATFEQLASIIAKMNDHRRVGVCLDTCHLLASGYDICSPEGYAATFEQFGRARRLRSAEGVSPERLEEAARQPRRSPRAHRPRLPRPRAVPAPRQRPPLPRICRCCWKRRRRRARPTGRSRSIRSTSRTSNTLRESDRGSTEGRRREGRRRSQSSVAILTRPGPSCLVPCRSPNTSASNRHSFAPLLPRVARQAGLVAGLREKRLARPTSIRSRPAAAAARAAIRCSTTRPWRPTSMSCGAGDRLERTEQRDLDLDAGEFVGVTGGNRGSALHGGDRARAHDAAERLGRLRGGRCSRAARRACAA